MSGTSVAAGSNLAITQQSVALTAQLLRAPGPLNAMTGPAPAKGTAEEMLRKNQSDPGMPFVRITDLDTDPKGDKVTVDAFNVVTGQPIMGDRNVSGNGRPMTSSSFDMLIDMATFNVDAGGKMSRQRTRHNLRSLARAMIANYFPQLIWQRAMVQAAGGRGFQTGPSWNLPLQASADFAEVMINPVKAPTYNRHLVVNGTSITRGGLQVASMATTDVWKLATLDSLALLLESIETKLPPPRFWGDEQAYDAPLKGVLMMPPSSYNSLITDISSTTSNLRAFQAAVQDRQRWTKDSAVFKGECGIWRGILVKKMEHTIYYPASASYQYIAVANRLTETETTGTVAAGLSTTHRMERSVLFGAQALARAEGTSNSGLQAAIIENAYDAGLKYEYIGQFMGGEAKFRFRFPNEDGNAEPTDNGIFVVDAAAPVVAV